MRGDMVGRRMSSAVFAAAAVSETNATGRGCPPKDCIFFFNCMGVYLAGSSVVAARSSALSCMLLLMPLLHAYSSMLPTCAPPPKPLYGIVRLSHKVMSSDGLCGITAMMTRKCGGASPYP
jgi:hypothetical protein